MDGWLSPSHWGIIVLAALVLFGYKKLPDAARSVGRSMRIFKTEMKGLSEDDQAREAARNESNSVAAESATGTVSAAPAAPSGDVAPSPLPATDQASPDISVARSTEANGGTGS
jgi:sec-independent protein translocase protein TatA